ncbi:preprotein translocase subunit YajC [Oligosphaera ethanolica]|uniref:Sec translocon accessory complex subunit YajC n=1 Tax=Oligosphaera ethanolica TaxID=760260 RepID=A0AAE3VD23_9BACT|nr:preprotein translocase subunit YajC [Oligosphaera ethanolica]MDQ0287931.1 preprotein translocase YajC subunit [Oligosphaera ethanolica]HQL08204.1 preprotein translocase subunit YajC [Lentisphaeria bacterium]
MAEINYLGMESTAIVVASWRADSTFLVSYFSPLRSRWACGSKRVVRHGLESNRSMEQSVEQMMQQAIGVFAQAQPSAGGGMAFQFLMMVPLLGILYFLMIRPQQKKQKEHQELLKKLTVGTRVMTSGGVIGTISRVDEKTVKITVAERVDIEVIRSAVATVLHDDDKKD